MNHQPFESWLLDDKHLTPVEKRDLEAHLRTCKNCSALAVTGLALRSARAAAPAPGFAMRFQQRLAAQKVAERRRRLWGLIVLTVSTVSLLGLFLAPYALAFVSAPVEWLTAALGYFLFLFTSIQAFGEVLSVFVRMLPSFLPPYVWMVILSGLAGVGLLWIVSIWRFARRPQGVTA
ncbi:MAG TPA: zf-HC2 domain-containing protein [Anaerolineales bacterium]|nr:hypothetical protein [Anaerolineae bacterium]HRJ55307.1 zf-HC2 domain-containing protein [Anaerolineales bacterium]HRK88298.1 zf-HC2 domain-containing protein [Anaerolineales bacterium]